jgi:hypothetical protein
MEEIPLLGGDVTEGVVRVGDTVRRPVAPHTPAVHALLRHLEAKRFAGAPRVLGIDEKNREILTYLPGEVTHPPFAAWAVTEQALAAVARLQRSYHEAVADFTPPPDAHWNGKVPVEVDGPPELITHSDLCFENVVFRSGPAGPVPYGFIDFDLARPATRLLDIIQTLRHWAPLNDPADRDPALRDADAAARVALFCDAYGLDADRRARLTAVARTVIRASHGNMAERARTLGGGWARMWAEGVGDKILRSAEWLQRNQQLIDARLSGHVA